MTRLNLEELFTPSSALRDEDGQFVGRTNELQQSVKRLRTPAASLAVIGERGIGKTSFAWQLFRLLHARDMHGDITQTSIMHGVDEESFSALKPGICVWIECRRTEMASLPGVLLALLRPGVEYDRTLLDQFPDVFSTADQQQINELFCRFSDALAGANIEQENGEYIANWDGMKSIYPLIYRKYYEVLTEIRRRNPKKELYIFIDEFDDLYQRDGLGEVIKKSSARYVVSGVAQSVKEIISDHQSAGRKITKPVVLGGLAQQSVRALYLRAQNKASEFGYEWKFSREFVRQLWRETAGHPYPVQRLGYATCDYLQDNELRNPDINTLRHVIEEEFGTASGDQYAEEIRECCEKPGPAAVLRALAVKPYEWVSEDQTATEVQLEGYQQVLRELRLARVIKRQSDKISFNGPARRLAAMLFFDIGVAN